MNANSMLLLSAMILATTIGCSDEKGVAEAKAAAAAPAPATAAPAATGGTATAADAKEYFASRCVVCHGAEGHGDGPGSEALKPKPRDLADATWQASVDDAYLKKVLLGGGAAVGKSFIMPGNPDLKGKDALQTELVKYLRGLKK